MTKKILIISLVILAGGLTAVFVFGKTNLFSKIFSRPVPSAIPYNKIVSPTPIFKPTVSTVVLAKEVNLDVPFTSQAPHKN